MAVTIDTTHLIQHYIPELQRCLDHSAGSVRRFQVHVVCAHATVVFHDSAFRRALDSEDPYSMLANPDALDWQPDPDDHMHELEVLHHLHQQAASSPVFSNLKDHTINDATTLVTSAVSPSFSTMTNGRLPCSFQRYSLRFSHVFLPTYFMTPAERPPWLPNRMLGLGYYLDHGLLRLPEKLPSVSQRIHQPSVKIVWDGYRRFDRYLFWQMQVDVVDLSSQRAHPCLRPRKRQRSAFNVFLQVSDASIVEATSQQHHLPHTEKFHGVRYRKVHKRWVAVMTPPGLKNKQEFGYFKSEAQAARAVDAAFHHYGKPHLLNFPDTSPNFLSTRPPAPAGLDESAKLKFVKLEAKWLATMATSTPQPSARPNSLPFQNPEPSTSCTALPSGQFQPFSEISWPLSCAGPDEADDAVSQS